MAISASLADRGNRVRPEAVQYAMALAFRLRSRCQRHYGWAHFFLLLASACLVAWAQQPPTVRTTVPVVVTPAVVTDTKGRLVPDAFENSFVLFDNGQPRPVQVDVEARPMSLVVLVQTNQVAVPIIRALRKAGGLFEELLLGDRGELALMTYERNVSTPLPFTSDHSQIHIAFQQLTAQDRAPAHLLDGVQQAVTLLQTRPAGRRRILLVLGENSDRGSTTRLNDVSLRIQQAGVVVYPVVFSAYKAAFRAKPPVVKSDKDESNRKPYDPEPELDPEPITGPPPGPPVTSPPSLKGTGVDIGAAAGELFRLARPKTGDLLASLSGGRPKLSFTGRGGVEQAVTQIGEELHDQYWLSFRPDLAGAAGFRTIQVRVKDRPDLVVRTRSGYWAVPASVSAQ